MTRPDDAVFAGVDGDPDAVAQVEFGEDAGDVALDHGLTEVERGGDLVYCPAAVCRVNVLASSDDQNPDMIGYTGRVTLTGYDNMTGLGTPNGQAFIQHLRRAG